jgi:8-oxo-dGTP pyrophosphatase MutT (NUDIX family)
MTDTLIHRFTTLDLKFEPQAWPWADEHLARIDAHFAERQRERPNLWNGRVLLAREPAFAQGRFSASYFETDFARFLSWRDWGFPDRSVFNGFGMGALRCADGAFIMGEMAAHTANAGRIYFPGGTPDPDDIAGDRVDIGRNITREIEEETGLTPTDYRPAAHWDCVAVGASLALTRVLHIDASGETVRARILAHLARQAQPELIAIHLVRNKRDLSAAMPRFVTAFVEHELSSS